MGGIRRLLTRVTRCAGALRTAVVLGTAVAGLLMLSAPAFADASAASPTTTTTTAIDNPDLGYAALGFGFAAVCAVLLFIRRDRSQTLRIQQALAAKGVATQPENVPDAPAAEAPAGAGAAELRAAAAGQAPVVITGPDHLQAGASAHYVSRRAGGEVVVPWTVQPAEILHVPAEATSHATITALKAGQVTLTAGGGTGKKVVVTAAPGPRPLQGLLFIGEGWGHVVVAIILASITAALGLAGAITGEAVATILGALVGYVVAKSQSGSAGPRSSAAKNGSGGADDGAQ